MSFVVAIDGPSGTGKGTITKLISKELGLINIDTGAMYRCVTLKILRNNISLEDIPKIQNILNTIEIDMKETNGNLQFFLNGEDVTTKIRESDVSNFVSQVSHIPIVRKDMVNLQRKMAEGKKVVMEGRDIGTNVFPHADVKIYLDATTEERANRRYKQELSKGMQTTYEDVLKNIIFRDENDKNSDVAPLKQAEDAIYIDTTNMTIEEEKNSVLKIIKKKLNEL